MGLMVNIVVLQQRFLEWAFCLVGFSCCLGFLFSSGLCPRNQHTHL